MHAQLRSLLRALAGLLALGLANSNAPADWTNAGGNAGRNGLIDAVGPDAPDVLWSGGRPSIIAWQPVIEGDRVFMVRQTGFPPEPQSNESPVVCQDLATGEELWAVNIPFTAGDWTTWIAGVKDGRVYASRSGNGASVSAVLHALDAKTGEELWVSDIEINAGPYDGVVFAPDGDPVVADFNHISRFNAEDGSTVFSVLRVCNVSSSCGGAIYGDSVYVADAVVGGNAIKKFSLSNGAFHYAGPLMIGFTLQNTPMVAPDGTIYLSRTQNNPFTDFFFSLTDTGTAIEINWFIPAGWSTTSEFAAGPDGSIYMMAPGNVLTRVDPFDGSTIDSSAPIPADFSGPRLAIDAKGRVFFSNGAFSNGRFYSFNADLTERWSVAVPNINIGAPAIGADGTLIVAGIGTNVTAYRTESKCPESDLDGDCLVNGKDLGMLLLAWGDCPSPLGGGRGQGEGCPEDLTGDGFIDGADLGILLLNWTA